MSMGSTPGSSGKCFAAAAILGVGVDVMFLPRLRGLITRQASRIKASSRQLETCNDKTAPASVLAAARMARRILHESELDEWKQRFGNEVTDVSPEQMQWLAVRWTAKEAAFKAVDGHAGFSLPNRPLTWHDAYVTKAATSTSGRSRPLLRYSEDIAASWKRHFTAQQRSDIPDKIPMPKIHLSISHDGDYVTAFVVSEGQEPS